MADSVSLLAEARAAGLTVQIAGDKLVVRGPQGAKPIVDRLKASTAAIVSLLRDSELAAPADGWTDDAIFTSAAPIRRLPRECIGPRVCSRLGPCERHVAGNPCQVGR